MGDGRLEHGRAPGAADVRGRAPEATLGVAGGLGMVVPTRNRAHTLRVVAPSFYAQEGVEEIVFVDDGSTDDTQAVLADLAARHPRVRTVVMRNAERQGASACRNRGVAALSSAHVLFCDDDEMLEAGYARTCLRKLI